MRRCCRKCKHSKVYLDTYDDFHPVRLRRVLCCTKNKTAGGDYSIVSWTDCCGQYEDKWTWKVVNRINWGEGDTDMGKPKLMEVHDGEMIVNKVHYEELAGKAKQLEADVFKLATGKSYAKELILDIHECDASMLSQDNLSIFFRKLCQLMDVEQIFHYHDDSDKPGREGEDIKQPMEVTTAVQFMRTNNVTVHAVDTMKRVYVNIFSCKDFDIEHIIKYCAFYFKGEIVHRMEIPRV